VRIHLATSLLGETTYDPNVGIANDFSPRSTTTIFSESFHFPPARYHIGWALISLVDIAKT